MEEMYDSLLENAKNPDRTVYNRFRSGIGQHIEETVLALAPDDPGALLPLNYSARPCRYHSIVQLKNIYDEFNKRSASYCARR